MDSIVRQGIPSLSAAPTAPAPSPAPAPASAGRTGQGGYSYNAAQLVTATGDGIRVSAGVDGRGPGAIPKDNNVNSHGREGLSHQPQYHVSQPQQEQHNGQQHHGMPTQSVQHQVHGQQVHTQPSVVQQQGSLAHLSDQQQPQGQDLYSGRINHLHPGHVQQQMQQNLGFNGRAHQQHVHHVQDQHARQQQQ